MQLTLPRMLPTVPVARPCNCIPPPSEAHSEVVAVVVDAPLLLQLTRGGSGRARSRDRGGGGRRRRGRWRWLRRSWWHWLGTVGGEQVVTKSSEDVAFSELVVRAPKPVSQDIRRYFVRVAGVRGAGGVRTHRARVGVKRTIKRERLVQKSLHHYFSPKRCPFREWYVHRVAMANEFLDLDRGYDSDDTQYLEHIVYCNRSVIAMRAHWLRQIDHLAAASRVSAEPMLRQMVVFYDRSRRRQICDHAAAAGVSGSRAS